jgi:hypothetical protein
MVAAHLLLTKFRYVLTKANIARAIRDVGIEASMRYKTNCMLRIESVFVTSLAKTVNVGMRR